MRRRSQLESGESDFPLQGPFDEQNIDQVLQKVTSSPSVSQEDILSSESEEKGADADKELDITTTEATGMECKALMKRWVEDTESLEKLRADPEVEAHLVEQYGKQIAHSYTLQEYEALMTEMTRQQTAIEKARAMMKN